MCVLLCALCMCVQVLRRSEDVGYPRAELWVVKNLMCWEPNPGPLERQSDLLVAEPLPSSTWPFFLSGCIGSKSYGCPCVSLLSDGPRSGICQEVAHLFTTFSVVRKVYHLCPCRVFQRAAVGTHPQSGPILPMNICPYFVFYDSGMSHSIPQCIGYKVTWRRAGSLRWRDVKCVVICSRVSCVSRGPVCYSCSSLQLSSRSVGPAGFHPRMCTWKRSINRNPFSNKFVIRCGSALFPVQRPFPCSCHWAESLLLSCLRWDSKNCSHERVFSKNLYASES